MNDTKSTPEDPEDGRGSVATGEQAGTPGRGPSTPGSSEPHGAEPGPDEESPAAGSASSRRPSPHTAPSAEVSPEPAASDAPPAPAGDPSEAGSGVGKSGPPASPGSGGRDPEPVRRPSGRPIEVTSAPQVRPPTRPALDGPTAQMRLLPNGSAPTGAQSDVAPASVDGGQPSHPASPESSRAPAPAPGPVPDPGPAAAAPPPWHRVPGQESYDRPAAAAPTGSPSPAGGLLDDGPTTFLESPHRSDTAGAEVEPETGGWAAVRAVRSRPPRQAALQLKRLDPWSVLKLALVLAVVLFFIWLVAVGVLYGVLDGMGVWDRLNGTYADLVSGEAPTGSPLISAGRVFGLAAVIGAINSLLFAVAVTVGAFVYNVSADLVGGIEVTLSERD